MKKRFDYRAEFKNLTNKELKNCLVIYKKNYFVSFSKMYNNDETERLARIVGYLESKIN